jgi:Fe-S-cluster containining protein
MAEQGTSTANLKLTVGELTINHAITVPEARVPASEVVPALQSLVNAVVAAAESSATSNGKTVSCRKGCGACCRQLVPVSRTEGERLLEMVTAMPQERRRALELRFQAAAASLRDAGLAFPSTKSDRELSAAYFALGIPCPFLEDESCSIHAERPLICREYLVTSPAALCSTLDQDGVTPVAVPKLSQAARRLQDDKDHWFPLALLMDWSRTRPRAIERRSGPEWIERFLKRMGRS